MPVTAVLSVFSIKKFMFAPQKSKSMGSEGPNSNNDRWLRLRAMQHIGMGIVYIIIAALLFWIKTFGSIELSRGTAYALGSLLLIYGVFRIWRGAKDLKQLKASGGN